MEWGGFGGDEKRFWLKRIDGENGRGRSGCMNERMDDGSKGGEMNPLCPVCEKDYADHLTAGLCRECFQKFQDNITRAESISPKDVPVWSEPEKPNDPFIEQRKQRQLTRNQKAIGVVFIVWLLSAFIFWLADNELKRGFLLSAWFFTTILLSSGVYLIAYEEFK